MTTSVRLVARASAVAVLLTTAAPALANYSEIYVFGDSLVDAGNIQIITGGAAPAPNQGYFMGRFTNGPDYTDLLYQAYFGTFTTPSLAGGTNYAFGGARVANNSLFSGASFDTIPDLGLQVGSYLASAGGVANPTGLYVVTATGNDVFAMQSGRINGLSQTDYIDLVVDTLADNLLALDAAGAGTILLTGVPNSGVASAIALETAIQARLATLSLQAELIQFSFFEFFNTVLTDPAALGLPAQDIVNTCIATRPLVDGERDCTGIFSFDGVHPTAAIHEALFAEIRDIVPEPAALGLMGLGVMGLAALRRRRAL